MKTKSAKNFLVNLLKAMEDTSCLFDSDFVKRTELIFSYAPMSKKIAMAGSLDSGDVYKGFKNLEYRGLIQKSGGGYKFTKKGTTWYKKLSFKYFKIKHKKWDKKWRVVIFDIPKEFDKKRDIFRGKLKELGFYMLQKSVFIFPYSCENELKDLCSMIGIEDYVDILVAESGGLREGELKEIYNLV